MTRLRRLLCRVLGHRDEEVDPWWEAPRAYTHWVYAITAMGLDNLEVISVGFRCRRCGQ